eukprot:1706805-Prymnesium_polylepis.1
MRWSREARSYPPSTPNLLKCAMRLVSCSTKFFVPSTFSRSASMALGTEPPAPDAPPPLPPPTSDGAASLRRLRSLLLSRMASIAPIVDTSSP